MSLLEHIIELNQKHLDRTAQKVMQIAPSNNGDIKIAAWGLTFKAGTDDLRYSPAIEVLQRLENEGYKINAFDPMVKESIPSLPLTQVRDDPYACVKSADALVVLTEWVDFVELDMETVAESMRNPNLIDTRNIFTKSEMENLGFKYVGMGN